MPLGCFFIANWAGIVTEEPVAGWKSHENFMIFLDIFPGGKNAIKRRRKQLRQQQIFRGAEGETTDRWAPLNDLGALENQNTAGQKRHETV